MLLRELAHLDVGILGAGREGLAVWQALRSINPAKKLTIYTEADACPVILRDRAQDLDEVVLGTFKPRLLARHDVLVRSPGVSPYRSELQHARSAGVRFTTASSLWFSENPEAKTISITGTKGKSTTTALVAFLLNACGVKAGMAGNIGRPLMDCQASECDWWVVELSSYQLSDLEGHTRAGAVLNLSDEHLDWHGGASNYAADKLRMSELAGDAPLIINFEDARLRERFEGDSRVHWFNHPQGFHVQNGQVFKAGQPVVQNLPDSLPGHHNLQNLAAALTIVDTVTTLPGDVENVLAKFAGLPHRLSCLGERGQIRYVDDSLSTTPVATLAALEAWKDRDVSLLIGGFDRGLDWSGLVANFKRYPPWAVISLPDNGDTISDQLKRGGLEPEGGFHHCKNLQQAVALAAEITPRDGVVLLSPGAPSFPHFVDFQHRGEEFARLAGFDVVGQHGK